MRNRCAARLPGKMPRALCHAQIFSLISHARFFVSLTQAASREAVSTAFLIFPPQSVAIDELSQLFRKCADAMMFFLMSNVSRDLIHIRFCYRECAIAPAPGEFSRY